MTTPFQLLPSRHPMKTFPSLAGALCLLAAAVLAGCGGGSDDESGGGDGFQLSPSAATLTGPNSSTCGAGTARAFMINGAGAYRVTNPFPDDITVTMGVDNQGLHYIDVTGLGACLDATIVVVDQRGQTAEFHFVTEKAEGS